MKKFIHVVSSLIVGVAVSISASADTASDHRAVAKVIKGSLSATEAEAILHASYDGFVEIRGKAKKDVFQFTKVKSKSSFPDNRWEASALSLVDQIEVPLANATSSSRFKPSATAYVYFYRNGVEGVNTAGARQVNVVDGEGDYMALLVIREKEARGGVSVQSQTGNFNGSNGPAKKVYKFELDA